MRPGEFSIDTDLVRSLVDEQFPDWEHEPLRKVESSGTDNAMFRLGGNLVVRLPRLPSAAESLRTEQAVLPTLAKHVSVRVPEIIGIGSPSVRFAYPWSIYGWIDGEDGYGGTATNNLDVAQSLGDFVRELRSAPAHNPPSSFRGGALSERDAATRSYIEALASQGQLDAVAAAALWSEALSIPTRRSAAWLHADLLPGNIVLANGQLKAVIDFGGCGVGDPSCDLMAGWTLFDRPARQVFLRASHADREMIHHGRAWAFSVGIGAWEFYQERNATFATVAKRAALEALQSWNDNELA